MHRFHYRKNILYCEDVPVTRAADEFGTPLYLYSHGSLVEHYRKLAVALRPVRPLLCFSMKVNPNLAVVRTLVEEGAGIDIVSGGELFRALRAGAAPARIVYAGVGKTEPEIRESIRRGILLFNVESVPELEAIDAVAGRMGKRVKVAIRVNPDVSAHTHQYITTGKKENKFGLSFEAARGIFRNRIPLANVDVVGIHVHLGSQITGPGPYVAALRRLAPFVEELRGLGAKLEYFNLGGGLGIVYRNERPRTAAEFARAVLPYLKRMKLKIILEPGRFIAGNSGILLTRVVYLKRTEVKNFVIVDAAMNDLIRPSFYGAYHGIIPAVRRAGRGRITADVVGAICESGDFLAKDRRLAAPRAGELLAVMTAGAYGFTMSSNYNSRPRAAEAMVKGNRLYLVRKRETYRDLVRGETIPAFLK